MVEIQREALAGVIEAARQRRHVPGAAYAVLHGGEVFAEGFGVTSVENPLLVNADTLFQIGSVTKTFTGTAAMMLVEQGKLDLDAPIVTYLPDLKLPGAETTANVTLRHLFTHTGGWEGDFFDDYGNGDDALTRYVAEMHDLPQLAPLGTLWSYNNAGFNLAGRVIEVVAGKPYEEVVKELIFDKLGMTRTSFFPAEVMLHRFGVGHNAGENPTVASPWPIPRCSSAAGAISSTVNDMLKYARFYLNNGVTESGERLLKAETVALMQSELFPVGGWAQSVGVTFYMRDVQNVRLVGHGGSTNGFQASFQLAPAENFAFVGLTNASNGSALNTEILDWALENILGVKEPAKEPITQPDAGEYVGTYQATLTQWNVTQQDGQLYAQYRSRGGFPTRNSPPPTTPPPAPVRISFYAPDKAVLLDAPFENMQVEFLRGADGKLAWLRAGGRVHRPISTE